MSLRQAEWKDAQSRTDQLMAPIAAQVKEGRAPVTLSSAWCSYDSRQCQFVPSYSVSADGPLNTDFWQLAVERDRCEVLLLRKRRACLDLLCLRVSEDFMADVCRKLSTTTRHG